MTGPLPEPIQGDFAVMVFPGRVRSNAWTNESVFARLSRKINRDVQMVYRV